MPNMSSKKSCANWSEKLPRASRKVRVRGREGELERGGDAKDLSLSLLVSPSQSLGSLTKISFVTFPVWFRLRRVGITLFWVFFLPSAAFAQTAVEDEANVVDLHNRRHAGPLKQLSKDFLTLGHRPRHKFETSELLRLTFLKRRRRSVLDGSFLFLDNDDRLAVQPESMDDENLFAVWTKFPAWPKLRIPLETIRGMIFENHSAGRRVVTALLELRNKNDTVILKNGDRVNGELLTIQAGSLSLEGVVGKIQIERSAVRGVALNSELISFPKVVGKRVLLTLSDGSRLTATDVSLQANGLISVDAAFGGKLKFPVSDVISLQFLGGRAVYVSDLEPVEYRFTPFLATRWSLRNDHNVTGGPLRLRGREFAKGLGMHSQSTVSYVLDQRYQQFQATVGIDDSTAGQGSATFAVEVDEKRVFTSDSLTGNSAPLLLPPIDVTGGRRLTLIVGFGQFGDIQDHANWCDALLIRQSGGRD